MTAEEVYLVVASEAIPCPYGWPLHPGVEIASSLRSSQWRIMHHYFLRQYYIKYMVAMS